MSLSLLNFIILGLATFRVSRLITEDYLTVPLREKIWNRFPPETTKTGYFISCPWCVSFWVGSVFIFWYTISPVSASFIAVIFALSAVAGLLAAYENK